MKLTAIFTFDKDTNHGERIEALAEVIATAREKYGNTDDNIEAPEVNTTAGLQDIDMLSAHDKLIVARTEFGKIKVAAVEFAKATEGAVLDKKIEELLALNPVMTNITKTIESDYL